jgi:hypothetical protein
MRCRMRPAAAQPSWASCECDKPACCISAHNFSLHLQLFVFKCVCVCLTLTRSQQQLQYKIQQVRLLRLCTSYSLQDTTPDGELS